MNIVRLMGMYLAVATMCGCAHQAELIKSAATSTRADIFMNAPTTDKIPVGLTELDILLSVKTPHKKTSDYTLLVNIDGQAISVLGTWNKESLDQRSVYDPESGEGIRYSFKKKLWLKPGTHRLIVALPENGIAIDKEITLLPESDNELKLEPVYAAKPVQQTKPAQYFNRHFFYGIGGLSFVLNGKALY